MTTHELAKLLIQLADVRVVIQATANDKPRPCRFVAAGTKEVVLTSTGHTGKAGGRRG